MSTSEIDNSMDVIDSRDIIARIAYLESDLEADYETYSQDCEAANIETLSFEDWLDIVGTYEAEEYCALRKLQSEAEASPDWQYGEGLVRDSYFPEYAEQLVKDCGMLPQELPYFIECNIDWEGVAQALKQDYMSVDFNGEEYWIRA